MRKHWYDDCVKLLPVLHLTYLNVFLQVSTDEDNGILLYNGDNDHIAVELYQGHVKVSYDPGSQPGHAIYR